MLRSSSFSAISNKEIEVQLGQFQQILEARPIEVLEFVESVLLNHHQNLKDKIKQDILSLRKAAIHQIAFHLEDISKHNLSKAKLIEPRKRAGNGQKEDVEITDPYRCKRLETKLDNRYYEEHYKTFSAFIIYDVLKQTSLLRRLLTITRWLEIMTVSFELGDLPSVHAIYHHLAMDSITKLFEKDNFLTAEAKEIFNKVKSVFAPEAKNLIASHCMEDPGTLPLLNVYQGTIEESKGSGANVDLVTKEKIINFDLITQTFVAILDAKKRKGKMLKDNDPLLNKYTVSTKETATLLKALLKDNYHLLFANYFNRNESEGVLAFLLRDDPDVKDIKLIEEKLEFKTQFRQDLIKLADRAWLSKNLHDLAGNDSRFKEQIIKALNEKRNEKAESEQILAMIIAMSEMKEIESLSGDEKKKLMNINSFIEKFNKVDIKKGERWNFYNIVIELHTYLNAKSPQEEAFYKYQTKNKKIAIKTDSQRSTPERRLSDEKEKIQNRSPKQQRPEKFMYVRSEQKGVFREINEALYRSGQRKVDYLDTMIASIKAARDSHEGWGEKKIQFKTKHIDLLNNMREPLLKKVAITHIIQELRLKNTINGKQAYLVPIIEKRGVIIDERFIKFDKQELMLLSALLDCYAKLPTHVRMPSQKRAALEAFSKLNIHQKQVHYDNWHDNRGSFNIKFKLSRHISIKEQTKRSQSEYICTAKKSARISQKLAILDRSSERAGTQEQRSNSLSEFPDGNQSYKFDTPKEEDLKKFKEAANAFSDTDNTSSSGSYTFGSFEPPNVAAQSGMSMGIKLPRSRSEDSKVNKSQPKNKYKRVNSWHIRSTNADSYREVSRLKKKHSLDDMRSRVSDQKNMDKNQNLIEKKDSFVYQQNGLFSFALPKQGLSSISIDCSPEGMMEEETLILKRK